MAGFEVIGEDELKEISEVFNSGGILFRHGFEALRNNCFKVREFEQAFAKVHGVKYSLAVSSGTAALRVAFAALGIGPGDEVIAPSFTFVATAEAIIEARAIPVCADIDLSLNLDPVDLERRITPRTKAVVVVHMLGTPARLSEITEICRRHDLFLIEDTAWGCGGSLHSIPLGTWGDVGAFSFDFAKTMTTGEGGMLLFRDEDVFQRACAWHDHGHENNPTVPRWEDTRSSSGFNFRMMELQGAVGLAQLKKLSMIVASQQKNKELIWRAISDLKGIEERAVPEGSYETADALVFLVEDSSAAKLVRNELVKGGFSTKILPEAYSWHFSGTWHHMPELVKSHGGNLSGAFLQSQEILSRAVSLPIGVKLASDVPLKIRNILIRTLCH